MLRQSLATMCPSKALSARHDFYSKKKKKNLFKRTSQGNVDLNEVLQPALGWLRADVLSKRTHLIRYSEKGLFNNTFARGLTAERLKMVKLVYGLQASGWEIRPSVYTCSVYQCGGSKVASNLLLAIHSSRNFHNFHILLSTAGRSRV